MAYKNRRHADEDQMAAIASWISDCEQTYGCKVRVILSGPLAAGRATVRVEACDLVGERIVGVRVRRRTSYPNSRATSLCGAVLFELIQLHKDLEDYQGFCSPTQ